MAKSDAAAESAFSGGVAPADSSGPRSQAAIYTMVAIHVLLGSAGVWTFIALPLDATVLGAILGFPLLALAPSQASLLGFWAAFAGRGNAWRFVMVVTLVVGHYVLNDRVFDSGEMQFWLAVQVIQALPWLIAVLVARSLGLRLIHEIDRDGDLFQFSLRQALGWMAAVGVLLTAVRWMPEDFPTSFLRPSGWAIPGGCSLIAAASMWLTLGRRWLPIRLLLLPISVAAATTILKLGIGFLDVWVYATLMACEAAWLIVSLLVVRTAGYRLVWHWRFGAAESGDAS